MYISHIHIYTLPILSSLKKQEQILQREAAGEDDFAKILRNQQRQLQTQGRPVMP